MQLDTRLPRFSACIFENCEDKANSPLRWLRYSQFTVYTSASHMVATFSVECSCENSEYHYKGHHPGKRLYHGVVGYSLVCEYTMPHIENVLTIMNMHELVVDV